MHGGTPVFVIEDGPPPPASPKFTCHLTIPALSSPHGGYEQKSFTAVARAKKAAEHAAAEMALEFITACGLLPPAMPALSLIQGPSVTVNEVRGTMSLTIATRSCVRNVTTGAKVLANNHPEAHHVITHCKRRPDRDLLRYFCWC